MAEELGRIEKPEAESFSGGRKIFFVPFLYSGSELPDEYREKIEKYWKQVAEHISDLSDKLGTVSHVYHELIASGGETGVKMLASLNPPCHVALEKWLEGMEAVEDSDNLSEFMDWNRCLYMGLENPRVTEQVYNSYNEAGKKRNEIIARRIDETLKQGEIGILIFREKHQVKLPDDIQVFYVAPPALDEVKRWARDYEASMEKEEQEKKK